jgi:hypothetical protein
MTTNFTNNGILVSEGELISSKVNASIRHDGERNYVNISYVDRNGVYVKTTKSHHDYTFMTDNNTKTINGLLAKNENLYLFWNNLDSAPLYGV